jgi:catechol 2,3-dioxygenase-like lactoylglutathione lyase family enzyme
MKILHVAIPCRRVENADLFYGRLLGLIRSEPRSVPRELAFTLFGLDQDLTVIYYTSDDMQFEVFVGAFPPQAPQVNHVCLKVADLEAFLTACQEIGAQVIRAPKGDKVVIFIRDLDGNAFEVKA